jgi:GDPmannose 4,6-dehydratase
VREFLDLAGACCGLDWTSHVEVDPRYYRPTEVEHLLGDSTKAQRVLGWRPRVGFQELVKRMVDHDMDLARQECRLNEVGHTRIMRGVAHG